MDPNYFVLDYHRLTDVLLTVVVFSVFLERALSVIFESHFYIEFTKSFPLFKRKRSSNEFLDRLVIQYLKLVFSKELITLALALSLCRVCHLDAFTILLACSDKTTALGETVTAGIVAGGSKVSIKLFRDIFKIMSTAEKERLLEIKKHPNTSHTTSDTTPYDNPQDEK